MQSGRVVRAATVDDAGDCAKIYAHYVLNTAVSFETEPPTVAEMADRIAVTTKAYAWLVLQEADKVVGYAYGHAFAPRAAYRWSCETSVYLAGSHTGLGGGRAVYTALLARLAQRGYRRAMAGITLPNEASVRLHQALGFDMVGVYRRVGWKHDSWHDVARLQKSLVDDTDPPAEPS